MSIWAGNVLPSLQFETVWDGLHNLQPLPDLWTWMRNTM